MKTYVITLSQQFPKGHRRHGEPTYFREQFQNTILDDAGVSACDCASVEPIIDITSSMNMIAAAADCCDLFKVGLQSGKKYERCELLAAMEYLVTRFPDCKFYFKDSFVNQARIDRAALPGNCVACDYNMFNH